MKNEMLLGESDQLLDLIYEAALVPEKWPTVLDRMAQIAGGVGTFLIAADPRTIRWARQGKPISFRCWRM
jgi:hypothetical protein